MKPLADLINRTEPAWPMLQQWIAEATNRVEVLPPIDDATRNEALYQTQVTTRSPMGAVIYETGGLLIDGGWLRILGSGHPRLPRSLPACNRSRTYRNDGVPPPFLLVGDDVVGGFFAIDGGGLQTGARQGLLLLRRTGSEWGEHEEGLRGFSLLLLPR